MAVRDKITHVIFDMDGTLLDTEPVYTIATQEILAKYGKKFEWSLKSKMMGQRAIDAARILVEETQIPITPEEYLALREPRQNELFASAPALPGVTRLVAHLQKSRVPQAVATSSHGGVYAIKRSAHSFFDLFDHVVVGDDPHVKHGKPAPDIFLEVARRWGVTDMKQVLVFEDAVSGVAAARAAGMHVVAIPDKMADLSLFNHADQVLTSLVEFNPAEWHLPAFEDNSS